MKKKFVETRGFTNSVVERLEDADYAMFQKSLIANPDSGDVIKGCGGLRKIRLPDPKRQKGKRGGARVIYLHVPEANWILLLDIYDKDEKEDLTTAEKKILKQLADEFKKDATEAASRSEGEDPK